MSRIRPAPHEQYAPLFGPDASLGLRIHAHNPELAKRYLEFTAALRHSHRSLPARLTELVRLRIAFHNQCRSCMAIRYTHALEDGVTEAVVCSLEQPAEADDLTDAERAALEFADLMATNHLAIDDGTYERLREHFSEAEIVELGYNCALCVGFGRLSATWDMVDDLPDRFRAQDADVVTPWGEGDVLQVP